MRTGKGGYEGNYSAKSRFEEGEGTNPEELIGAAHAGCFSMALSKALTDAGFPPNAVDTTANVHLERVDGQQTVTRIDLTSKGDVPRIDEVEYRHLVQLGEGLHEPPPPARAATAAERIGGVDDLPP